MHNNRCLNFVIDTFLFRLFIFNLLFMGQDLDSQDISAKSIGAFFIFRREVEKLDLCTKVLNDQ